MSRASGSFLLSVCLVWSLTAGQAPAELWTQTTWEGGPGQQSWSDTARYYVDTGMDWMSSPGDLMLRYPGWEKTGELADANVVMSIIQAQDGSLYAATWENGDVFRSTDAGTTWVNTGELPGVEYITSLLEAVDGAIYAAVPDRFNWNGRVYKTTDSGATWVETGDLPGAGDLYELIQAQDGTIYASCNYDIPWPAWPGRVFKTANGGTTWTVGGEMDSITDVFTVFQAADASIYAGGTCLYAFRTTDGGGTWSWTGHAGWVYAFLQDAQGALYAGVRGLGGRGHVLKSVDAGTTWVDMVQLPGTYTVETLLESFDGTIYAGTDTSECSVFRSTDAGTTWVHSGHLAGAWAVLDLLQAQDGTIYAASSCAPYDAAVFRWCPPQGDLVSSVYSAGPNPEYGLISWDESLNGQVLVMKVRTDTLSDMSTAPEWDSCPPAVNGDDISGLSSVTDGDPYIQYRVEMISSYLDSTPLLHEVRIEYTVTGIDEAARSQVGVSGFRLFQNSPNPFTQETVIRYQLAAAAPVSLKIFDRAGQLVRTLVDEVREAGLKSTVWDGRDDRGRSVPSGIYFSRLAVAEFTATKKLVLLH